jgi:uncharacterized protein with WD repeat
MCCRKQAWEKQADVLNVIDMSLKTQELNKDILVLALRHLRKNHKLAAENTVKGGKPEVQEKA